MGHALIDLINQCDDQHFNRAYFDEQLNTLFATKTYWVTENSSTQYQENKEWDQWAFFTASKPISKYETVRENFIGFYSNESKPAALESGQFSCQDRDFGNIVGALYFELELDPGHTENFHFLLGVLPKTKFEQQKETILQKYNNPEQIKHALKEVSQYWQHFFSHTQVKSPDQEFNTFMNYWTPYQAKVAFDVGRVASFYYWGIARGYGFRDTAQDTIAITIAHPEKAKERIKLLARQMFKDGQVYHHFYGDGQGKTTEHCDDPVWFILAVTNYIKETGDFDILNHKEKFVDTQDAFTIYDHLLAVIQFIENNLGKHGLPLFGRGDWNDTLDYIGGKEGGESVWGAMFYITFLKELNELLKYLNKNEEITRTEKLIDLLTQNVDKYCWDGEWYLRAFGDNGTKIGSKSCESGKIFLNTQTWAVLAQLPDQQRLKKALASVKSELDSDQGPKICAPAFRQINPKIGLITRCVAGKKENAAVFCHPTTWLIQAECLLGNGNQAYYYYKKLLPSKIPSSLYKTEPYVYPQYITSDEHPTAGQASHSWQTGTAAWMYRVIYDYFLGVRPTYDGLLIDPVIPAEWREVEVRRKFRGVEYFIKINNPRGLQRGVKSVKIDNQLIEGNLIPEIKGKTSLQIEVFME